MGKINVDTLFYLMSRGIPENEDLAFVVVVFFYEFTKGLPTKYVLELNRFVECEMEKAIG